ncbi:aldehyde dehydrogenase family protein [Ruegeria haliotis]|uniref:aldehyde dehydrogenase family protein n=1 Tax=Ruegeria haliotis TaxID=2747601 RepID=UPI001F36B818|nr:aldehyde dehydrogenase family protein [Ruegeria haliotis]
MATTGGPKAGKGYFFQSTVLLNVPDNGRIMQQEPFGPVAATNPASLLDHAIEQANSMPYDPAGYRFTNRADYFDRLVDEVGNQSIKTLEASMPKASFGA